MITADITFGQLPIFLWEPDARQWTRWMRARRRMPRFGESILSPGIAWNMRWPMRRGHVGDIFQYVDEFPGDRAGTKHFIGASDERHLRRRLRYLAHPTMRWYIEDTPMAYVRSVRRVHLALRVVAARREGSPRFEWNGAEIPTVHVERYGKDYSLVTPLDIALSEARTIDAQVEAVSRWATKEFQKCMRPGVITSPALITPAKVAKLEGDEFADRGPQIGIATGIYGLTIIWLLQALRDPPNVGACLACARPFLRARGSRRKFCGSTCRSSHHRLSQPFPPRGAHEHVP